MRFLKTFAAFVLVIGAFVALPASLHAQGVSSGCLDDAGALRPEFAESSLCKDLVKNQTPADNSLYGPNGLVTEIASIISMVVGVAAVVMIIVGGVRYVLSGGDSQNLQSAKNTIIFALVGLGVAIFAQLIVVFVVSRL